MSDYETPNFTTDLTGQVALVTGTTSGLGARFAKILAACGAKVALTGRRVDRLDSLAEEIRTAGGDCLPLALDMMDRDSIRNVVDAAEAELGTITILVNISLCSIRNSIIIRVWILMVKDAVSIHIPPGHRAGFTGVDA